MAGVLIDDWEPAHLYYARRETGNIRLCAGRGGHTVTTLAAVTCPVCRLMADPPPALDDLVAVEAWLVS